MIPSSAAAKAGSHPARLGPPEIIMPAAAVLPSWQDMQDGSLYSGIAMSIPIYIFQR